MGDDHTVTSHPHSPILYNSPDMIYKKDMNSLTNYFQSFIRIIGLSGGIVIFCLGIFYIWFKWFGPGNDPSATFPQASQGEFIQPVVVTVNGKDFFAHWSIPAVCQINEVEIQEVERAGEFGWMGGTADCVQEKDKFICQADLTDRGLLKDVTYRLQAHNSQCTDGQNYVSTVITLTP